MCLLCENAIKLSKIREDPNDKEHLILVFEGFDFIKFEKSLFSHARDFRDYPTIANQILHDGMILTAEKKYGVLPLKLNLKKGEVKTDEAKD